MRAALLLGILLLVALAVLGLLFLGATPREGDVVTPPPTDELAANASVSPGTREAVPSSAEEPVGTPPAETPVDPPRRKDEEAFWRRCTGLPPAEVRDCIRAGLAGRVPTPAELAGLACAGGPPDGADLLLAVEVIHRWNPAEVPAGLLEFGQLCPGSDDVGIALVRDLFPSDPVWCDRLAAAIRPELAFSAGAEGSRGLLVLVDALAEAGFEDERLLLEAGARGDFGGSDAQGAFALVNAWALQREERGRIEFLASVMRAPNFQGRAEELRVLVECATDPAMVEEDVASAFALVDELLSHPRLARGAAERLLELYRFSRLPRWLTSGEGAGLLARAKEMSGGG